MTFSQHVIWNYIYIYIYFFFQLQFIIIVITHWVFCFSFSISFFLSFFLSFTFRTQLFHFEDWLLLILTHYSYYRYHHYLFHLPWRMSPGSSIFCTARTSWDSHTTRRIRWTPRPITRIRGPRSAEVAIITRSQSLFIFINNINFNINIDINNNKIMIMKVVQCRHVMCVCSYRVLVSLRAWLTSPVIARDCELDSLPIQRSFAYLQ